MMKRKKEHKQQQTGKKKLPTVAKEANTERWKYYVPLSIILLLSFIAYFPALKNGFVWDDEYYIINNNLIKNLSWTSIKVIFLNFSSDNYAPLTDLINAVQYKISGLSPAAFHVGSLVFHLLNVALVFWFIKLLCSRWDMAAITALFFGIHPMQVESVAWASGGSNLFCAAFFLGSLVAYLYYLRHSLKRYLVISLLFFILSLLTKAVAVVLPVILLLIDYYKGRKITIKILLEKSPFLILSLGAGILSLLLKYQVVSISNVSVFSFPQRIIFAPYGFITYLYKLLFPLNLCAYYPYPIKNGVNIPIQYYAYILFFLGLTAYVIYSLRFSKKIFFAIGFFAVNIFLVLQLFPVGDAFIADRYIYIPSIGIFYLAGEAFNLFWSKKLKLASLLLLGIFTVFFSVKTYSRCGVWENNITLWNDVISQYKTVAIAYYNRGNLFMNEKRIDEAIIDFNKAIEMNPNFARAYNNRGSLFMDKKRNDEALNDFNKSIELEPGYANVYYNRGTLFMNEKRNDEAIIDFNRAIELNPNNVKAYYNRGTLLMDEKRNDDAINDFNKVIELEPGYANAYYNRGLVEFYSGKKDAACMDMKKAASLGHKSAAMALLQICK